MKLDISTWVCATCSQGFTRRSSSNRHNLNIHGGMAIIVRPFDYIVGRLEGKYAVSDPLIFRKNNGKNFRKQGYTANSEHLTPGVSYGDSIPGKESYDRLPWSGPPMQVKDSRRDFSDLDYTIDLASRVLKIKNLMSIQEAGGSTDGSITHAPFKYSCGIEVEAFVAQHFDIDYLFGFMGEACPFCVYFAICRIDFRDGAFRKRIWSTIHKCDSEALALYEKEKRNRGIRYVEACDLMPSALVPFVMRWLKGSLYIFAIKLPYLYDRQSGLIEITNPNNPSESICIPFFNKDLPIRSTDDPKYWVSRAVANENKPTPLNGQVELLSFLKNVSGSTFGVFNVCSRKLLGYKSEYYLIYLGKGVATVNVHTDG